MTRPRSLLRFGTDGVRGVSGEDLTAETVALLGRATARVVGSERPFLIGRDTRQSGPEIEDALGAGLVAEGAVAESVGVLPTPGLAYLSQARELPAAMISASHNPFSDNGIKLFAAGGRKLPDELERRIEEEMATLEAGSGAPAAPQRAGNPGNPGTPGVVDRSERADRDYLDHLATVLAGRTLDGLRVVVDCANGAAWETAPRVLRRLGAEVEAIAVEPDGRNINEACGSTHPDALREAVVDRAADVGLAFDGDADRVIAVDEGGSLVDGDHIIAVAALDLRDRGLLRDDTVVTTVMANLGFRKAMEGASIRVVETKVGDRHVLDAMDAGGYSLGGEQSGHVIFADLATTGDGVLTGLVLLDVMTRSGRRLSDLASVVTKLPQVLVNVRVADRDSLAGARSFWEDVARVESELGEDGRVLVRPSGTEPVVRVMVEAPTEERAQECARRLADRLADASGPGDP